MAKAKAPKPRAKAETKKVDEKKEKPAKIPKKSAAALLQQQHLPGMKPEMNENVHAAAIIYAKARDKRMAAGEEEKDAEKNLLYIMGEEKVKRYEYNGVIVDLMNTVKPKVVVAAEKSEKKKKAKKNGDEE